MALIFDIETIGVDYDALDEPTQKNLTRWIYRQAGNDKKKYNALFTDLKEGLGFSPLTGEIVAIGVYDDIKNKGVVYYSTSFANSKNFHDKEPKESDFKFIWGDKEKKQLAEYEKQENFEFKPMNEKEMLTSFWQGVSSYREFVSFNGRSFDVPFLVLRSAVHQIRPSLNLMTNRYLKYQQIGIRHFDLFDQLSFYGAVRRRGNLHLYCRAFGIDSPKDKGITGDDVKKLFKQKKYQQIALYNSWDLIATTKLYKLWKDYISSNL